jgi:hypothetical protein
MAASSRSDFRPYQLQGLSHLSSDWANPFAVPDDRFAMGLLFLSQEPDLSLQLVEPIL